MATWNISGRINLQGTVTTEGTALRWNITAPVAANFTFGSQTSIPLAGDWDGNGTEGIGAYEPGSGTFFLKQVANGIGVADITVQFGPSGLTPISWHDTIATHDQIGLIQGNTVLLNKGFHPGNADIITTTDNIVCYSPLIEQCTYAVSIVGTINGRLGMQGTVTAETTNLRWNITAPAAANFIFSTPGTIPLVGNWNGSGEGIGAYNPSTGTFFLKYTPTSGVADITVQFGSYPGQTPISWYDKSANHDQIGIISGSNVFLDKGFHTGAADIATTTGNIVCYSPLIEQCSAAMLNVTNITGTTTATFGTDAVTFTATVTNSGTASGTATVTFYIGTIATPVGTPQPTGTISIPNGTGTVSIIINPSTWVVGTYSVCAKTNYE